MVMHSKESGECCPRTLVDRQRKRYHNAVDVVIRLHDPTDQVPNARHLRVQHTFSSMTSLELRSSRVLRESFVSTTAWWRWWCSTDAGLRLSTAERTCVARMFGFGNWWQSLWTNGCLELYLKDLSIGISWSPCVGFKEFMRWPRCYSRNYPKIGPLRVELIASMSWRRRLCDHSCLPSRHHPNEESWKDSRLIKTKSKSESSWSTHKA